MSDDNSVHRRLPRLLVELEEMFEVDRTDPRRFAFWKMRNAAWQALESGMRTAAEIIDAARAMKQSQDTSTASQEQK